MSVDSRWWVDDDGVSFSQRMAWEKVRMETRFVVGKKIEKLPDSEWDVGQYLLTIHRLALKIFETADCVDDESFRNPGWKMKFSMKDNRKKNRLFTPNEILEMWAIYPTFWVGSSNVFFPFIVFPTYKRNNIFDGADHTNHIYGLRYIDGHDYPVSCVFYDNGHADPGSLSERRRLRTDGMVDYVERALLYTRARRWADIHRREMPDYGYMDHEYE